MFPMLYPNSGREPLFSRAYAWSYQEQTTKHDTADGEVSSLKRKGAVNEICLSAPDHVEDRNLAPTARHSSSLGTILTGSRRVSAILCIRSQTIFQGLQGIEGILDSLSFAVIIGGSFR